jgi:hypothetical protein
MKTSSKRKTVVEIDLSIWAKVRYFATISRISNNAALEALLIKALKNNSGNNQDKVMLAGGNDFAVYPPAASSQVQ